MAQKLLLADDSITIQKVVELVLAPEHFEVVSYSDGEQALKGLKTFMPDLVLADIEMPVVDGYKLCEAIKANEVTSHIPVLLLAGAFELYDEERAQSVGADGAIIKPFESYELVSRVKASLSEAARREVLPKKGFEQIAVTSPEAPEASFFGEPADSTAAREVLEGRKREEELPGAAEKEYAEPGKPSPREPVAQSPALSKEEISEIFKKAIHESVYQLVRTEMTEHVSSALKDHLERAVTALVPALVESLSGELAGGLLASLEDKVDALLRSSVPEIAETLIKREIEKISADALEL